MQPIGIFTIAFLFSGSLVLQVGCQTKQVAENITNNGNTQIAETNVSDGEIRQLFIDSGLGEGDGNLEKLMALPKERVISVVRKLKETGLAKDEYSYQSKEANESLKIKSAYFLWELGVDKLVNEKYVVDGIKSRDSISRFYALEYLGAFIEKGKKEYLPLAFSVAPTVDGAFAESIHGLFIDELETSPKTFLLYLSKEPIRTRTSVYELVSYTENMYGKGIFEKISENVKELTKDKETETIAKEFLRRVKTRN